MHSVMEKVVNCRYQVIRLNTNHGVTWVVSDWVNNTLTKTYTFSSKDGGALSVGPRTLRLF